MRVLFITLASLLLISCSFGGFKPPPRYYVWQYKYFNFKTSYDYYVFRDKEMRACGMEPVWGESDEPEVNLCLEQRNWYLKGGPVCENKLMWNRPLCIEWRAKHSKPDVKPWGKK